MKKIFIITSGLLVLVVALLAGYSQWNAASPTKTCASCHEISHSVDLWGGSTHRNIACKECHGTALSEGLHSLKEKGAMVFHHIRKINPEDVRISEVQRIGCDAKMYSLSSDRVCKVEFRRTCDELLRGFFKSGS